jgi:hypothetical protein
MIGAILIMSSLLTNPEPFLMQSVIDTAKIIGLPRLKTMDHFFAKAIYIDELHSEIRYTAYSRLDFLKSYIKLGSNKG